MFKHKNTRGDHQIFKYDINKFEINSLNHSYKTVINESNPNLIIIDIAHEKKNRIY